MEMPFHVFHVSVRLRSARFFFVIPFYHLFNLIKTKHSLNNQLTKSNKKLANTLPCSRLMVADIWYAIFTYVYSCCWSHSHETNGMHFHFLQKSVPCLLFVCNFAHFHKKKKTKRNILTKWNEWFSVCSVYDFLKFEMNENVNGSGVSVCVLCMFCLIKFICQQLKLWFFKSNTNQKSFWKKRQLFRTYEKSKEHWHASLFVWLVPKIVSLLFIYNSWYFHIDVIPTTTKVNYCNNWTCEIYNGTKPARSHSKDLTRKTMSTQMEMKMNMMRINFSFSSSFKNMKFDIVLLLCLFCAVTASKVFGKT